jgi:3D (Asp-Asp-Asp) domain-containing protein
MPKTALLLTIASVFWCGSAHAQTQPAKVLIMEATAFARAPQATAAGTEAHEGTVAADPAVLPLGTKIRITGTAAYDGNYLVTDTGAAVKGMHVDIYMPSEAEAKQFGTKRVRVQIRQMGTGKADARRKDTASH